MVLDFLTKIWPTRSSEY